MGRQIIFFMTPADLSEFEAKLASKLDYVILAGRSKSPTPFVLDSMQILKIGEEDLGIYLCRWSDLEQVYLKPIPAQQLWTIDALRSPVIQFDRCYMDDTIIRRGRLWYSTGYYDDNERWLFPSKDFLDFAQKLCITRQQVQKSKVFYAFPEALFLEQAGEMTLSQI